MTVAPGLHIDGLLAEDAATQGIEPGTGFQQQWGAMDFGARQQPNAMRPK